jgi:hypothetical protein
MDALSLRRDVAAAAPPPLLRAAAQALLAEVSRWRVEARSAVLGGAGGAGDAGVAAGPRLARGSRALLLELRQPRVAAQVALLRECKRALIAMEVGSWALGVPNGILLALHCLQATNQRELPTVWAACH